MKSKKIVFLILHYNTIEITKQCVTSILALDRQEDIVVVIVDNASPNGSGKELEKFYAGNEKIHVLLHQENAGFSGGNNFGYNYIKSTFSVKYMIVANNDIEFLQSDFLNRIDEEYKNSMFYVLGPDVWNTRIEEHQNPLDTHIRTVAEVEKTIRLNELALKHFWLGYPLMKVMEKLLKNKKAERQYQYRQVNCCLMGACLIFSEEFVQDNDKIFNPETFFYYEEYMLMYNCQKKGKVVIYNPALQVYHQEGSSTNSFSKSDKEKRRFIMQNIVDSAKIYRKYIQDNKKC